MNVFRDLDLIFTPELNIGAGIDVKPLEAKSESLNIRSFLGAPVDGDIVLNRKTLDIQNIKLGAKLPKTEKQKFGLDLQYPSLDLHGPHVDIDINLPHGGLDLHGPLLDLHVLSLDIDINLPHPELVFDVHGPGMGLDLHGPGLYLHGSSLDVGVNLPHGGLDLHGPDGPGHDLHGSHVDIDINLHHVGLGFDVHWPGIGFDAHGQSIGLDVDGPVMRFGLAMGFDAHEPRNWIRITYTRS